MGNICVNNSFNAYSFSTVVQLYMDNMHIVRGILVITRCTFASYHAQAVDPEQHTYAAPMKRVGHKMTSQASNLERETQRETEHNLSKY